MKTVMCDMVKDFSKFGADGSGTEETGILSLKLIHLNVLIKGRGVQGKFFGGSDLGLAKEGTTVITCSHLPQLRRTYLDLE